MALNQCIFDLRPNNLRPATLIVIVGEITSSSMYNNLKLGKAIAIKTKAGVIVQINSINVVPTTELPVRGLTISYTIE